MQAEATQSQGYGRPLCAGPGATVGVLAITKPSHVFHCDVFTAHNQPLTPTHKYNAARPNSRQDQPLHARPAPHMYSSLTANPNRTPLAPLTSPHITNSRLHPPPPHHTPGARRRVCWGWLPPCGRGTPRPGSSAAAALPWTMCRGWSWYPARCCTQPSLCSPCTEAIRGVCQSG